jgi:hypothetical protein
MPLSVVNAHKVMIQPQDVLIESRHNLVTLSCRHRLPQTVME